MTDSPARILVVDDEAAIRRVLETGLRARGYQVTVAATGREGVDRTALDDPDVVILDLGLPDMDGFEVCRGIRTWSKVPIVVLSVDGAETRKVAALDFGADDFITKPFSMQELLARIRVALRHSQDQGRDETGAVLERGPITVDLARHEVRVRERLVEVTDTEFRILTELVRNAGKVLTHEMLLRTVWGPAYRDDVHYLRVYINRLRKKLEHEPARPRLLVTVPRVGYRLDADPAE